jgi:hypothetical protein
MTDIAERQRQFVVGGSVQLKQGSFVIEAIGTTADDDNVVVAVLKKMFSQQRVTMDIREMTRQHNFLTLDETVQGKELMRMRHDLQQHRQLN